MGAVLREQNAPFCGVFFVSRGLGEELRFVRGRKLYEGTEKYEGYALRRKIEKHLDFLRESAIIKETKNLAFVLPDL